MDISVERIDSGASAVNSSQVNTEQPRTLRKRIAEIVHDIFWTLAMLFNPFVDFFTQGLSDFLALETLRHGTSFQNYLSIRRYGADPSRGGGGTGATGPGHYDIKASKDFFFLSKDREAYVWFLGRIGSIIANKLLPSRMYCGFSAAASVTGKGPLKMALRINVIALNVLFVPTLKFRFRPEDVTFPRFDNDPDNACPRDESRGLAYRTKVAIGTEHLGLKGILTQGLHGNIGARMKAHPGKVVWGLIRLINPIGILILLSLGIYLVVDKCREAVRQRKLRPIVIDNLATC